MKAALTRRFVPSDYKQRAYLQLTELVQGRKSIAEYTSMFYSLVTRSGFPWVEVLISMYCRRLNLDFQPIEFHFQFPLFIFSLEA